MSKLFVFAIGGTGARVVKALTMLLATGIKAETDEIIPIIIDPHTANDDLRRTLQHLTHYKRIQKEITNNGEWSSNGFFKTQIKTLQELSGSSEIEDSFAFNIQNVQNERFRQYIDLSSLDKANQGLAQLLFSEKSLDIEMNIGFIGHPNIGSIVLNQFKDSKEFNIFAQSFNKGDRIFIISSIFGGTGAAGFPVILKNIREAHKVRSNDKPLSNPEYLQNAVIGAATVQPYFSLDTDNVTTAKKAGINSEDFISKTAAALHYYSKNITGSKSVNAMYYIADNLTKSYKNDPGDGGQQNDAHFVEMATALSILDFLENKDLTTNEKGKADNPIYREFGIKSDERKLHFDHLAEPTQQLLKRPLTQYYLMVSYLNNYMSQDLKENFPFCQVSEPKIDNSFLSQGFCRNSLAEFNQAFIEWLTEMARNERGFAPLNLSTDQWAKLVNGIDIKKGGLFSKVVFDRYKLKEQLNKVKGTKYSNAAEKLINGLFTATDALLSDVYSNF